jgi:hypothetical protein
MSNELIDLLSVTSSQEKATLLCLGAIGGRGTIAEIRRCGVGAGASKMRNWNLSSVLSRASKLVCKVGDNWQLTTAGKKEVSALGLSPRSQVVFETDGLLAQIISSVPNEERRAFLEEAHLCFGAGLGRAAVVLSWVGAAWILQEHVIKNELQRFNEAGTRRFSSGKHPYKPVSTMEDFGRLKESDFLMLLEDIGVIGRSLHKQLKDRLDLRNGCGHPNTMAIDAHTVAAHVHFLCGNVYLKF